jgi:hypothetical protein
VTDFEREKLINHVIAAISTASVPHESSLPGALESRSLGYYLGVGIDHFEHDFNRHETLLRKAAEQAIAALTSRSERSMRRPKPIVQKLGNLTVISRTGEPTDEQELRESLDRTIEELRAREPRGPRRPTAEGGDAQNTGEGGLR